MAKGIKIPVTAPGAKQARRDIKGVADASKQLGGDAKAGGVDAAEGMDDFTGAMGVNLSTFTNWKIGLGAGIAAIIAGLKASYEHVSQIHEKMREAYREFSSMAQRPSTIALAQVRGESEAATVKWKKRTAAKYTIDAEEAGAADFGLKSGLSTEFDRSGLDEIGEGAFKTMRVFGARGKTVSETAAASVKAGVATTPAEVKDFLAKVGTFAKESAVDYQGLAQVVKRLLPLVKSSGIPVDRFLAMAAAMSFQISDPGELATTLERIIRSAGKSGPALKRYAAEAGKKLDDLTAAEIIDFQASVIDAAEGPQAKARAAKSLGIEDEIATLYGKAYGPETRAGVRKFLAGAGTASFADVEGQYAKVRSSDTAKVYAAKQKKELTEFEASQSAALMTEVEDLAEAEVTRAMGEGEDIGGWEVLEDLAGGDKRAKRYYMIKALKAMLKRLSEDPSLDAAASAEAGDLYRQFTTTTMSRGDIGASFQTSGGNEPAVREAFRFVQGQGGGNITINNGGVHFNGQYADPAGVRRDTGME